MIKIYMSIFLNLILLFFLFIVLGIAADLLVKNIKYLASVIKMRLFALGILLGIITTLPELSVGINATIEGVASVSVGNILGGIIVLIGLIVGVSLILNRKINTSNNLKELLPATIVILSPVLLGINGNYSVIDGLIMILLYIGLLFYIWLINRSSNREQIILVNRKKTTKAFFLAVISIIFVILSSRWIVEATVNILHYINISKLTIGLLVFSIGTNLPEITITFTSWRRKASELSLSHLISSAFANIFVLGVLAIMRPINFTMGPAYYLLSFFIILIMILFLYFCYSHKRLDRVEGFVLLGVYALFLLSNLFLIFVWGS